MYIVVLLSGQTDCLTDISWQTCVGKAIIYIISNDWNSRISLDKFPVIFDSEASTQKCSYKKVFWNIQQIYMPKWDFNKVAKQLYWYYTSTWVFYCKFAAYFQNTFDWRVGSHSFNRKTHFLCRVYSFLHIFSLYHGLIAQIIFKDNKDSPTNLHAFAVKLTHF